MCYCGKSPQITGYCMRMEDRPPGVMPTKAERRRISREDGARIAADRAAPAAPAADEREARQTRAPRVLAKARRVSEHSNAWDVMIGNTCVRQWMQGTYGDGPYRTAQESAEAFAAAINAELDGGIAAFGCIGESDYKKRPCMTWCGSARCVHGIGD